jgi:hypothetical protein
MAQVFVVVGAANVIAFIIRDLGQPAIVGWIIQVSPLQSSILNYVDVRRARFSSKQPSRPLLDVFQMSWIEDTLPPFPHWLLS